MNTFYGFQTILPLVHLLLLGIAAFQLRQSSQIDQITVFPWIMLLVYGLPPFGGLVFLILLTGAFDRRASNKSAEAVAKWAFWLVGALVIQFSLYFWLNSSGFHIVYADPIAYLIMTITLGEILLIGQIWLISPPAAHSAPKSPPIADNSVGSFLVELLLSIFLWSLLASTLWPSLYESVLYSLPPFWVFGITAALLTYKARKLHSEGRPLVGLWRCSPSVITFLWGAFIVLTPIFGPLLYLAIYPRLSGSQGMSAIFKRNRQSTQDRKLKETQSNKVHQSG